MKEGSTALKSVKAATHSNIIGIPFGMGIDYLSDPKGFNLVSSLEINTALTLVSTGITLAVKRARPEANLTLVGIVVATGVSILYDNLDTLNKIFRR